MKRDEAGQTVATRPICRYGEVARYRGAGDPAAAQSYRCAKATRMKPEER